MKAGDVLVQHVAFAKALVAELAVVGVHVGEVDVLNVLVGCAGVLEGFPAQAAAEPQLAAAAARCGRVRALHVLRETGLGGLSCEITTYWDILDRE